MNGLVSPDLQRGLIYTVHPRLLVPLVPGEEYRILASTRIRLARHAQLPSYEPLYRRARLLSRRRADELTCQDASNAPRIWVASHGWFRMDIPDAALAGAVVVIGAACGMAPPPGREEPTSEALCSPYTSEIAGLREVEWDEFYNDFDMRTSVDDASQLTVSYGEYVFEREGIEVDALMARALRRAEWYFDLTEPNVVMALSRQEWACLDTGKTAKPFLAHVTMYFDA
ncbi:MAG: hypothetical protein ACRD3G_28570 [Vicinamibacterales bacterium]